MQKIFQRIKGNGMSLPDSPRISASISAAMYMHIENKTYIGVVIKILLIVEVK